MTGDEWKKIKAEIEKETNEVFGADKSFNLAEALEIFRKVLDYPIVETALKLEGLPDLMPTIGRILIGNEVSGTNFNNLALPFEAYLKKILYLTDKKYYLAHSYNITLGDKFDKNKVLISNGLIAQLQLNPGNIQYWQQQPIYTNKHFGEHLWRAYNLRNTLAHFCKSYNRKQFWTGVQSYLVMYLWAANKHRQAILATVEPYFLSNYLQKYIADYQKWQQLFIHIEGVEKQELLESYVVEVPEQEQHRLGETIKEGDNPPGSSKIERPKSKPKRSGSVMDLRNSIPEKQMVIIAEPGMGKTTALQFMAYIDALDIESGKAEVNYPVFIELKDFQAKNVIKDKINDQLKIAHEITEKLLNDGKVTLLLDGLNETAQSLRDEAVKSISGFMAAYPNVFVIITCRPNAYERNYFDNIRDRGSMPVFQLQPMGMQQIEEFLQKNCNNEDIRNSILQALQNNENLSRVVETPLLLKMLIAVVSRQPKEPIPPTETGIVLGFLDGIYQREAKKNAGFDPELLKELLPILAHQTRMKYQANVGLPPAEAINILINEADKKEIKATLKKGEELHILARNSESNHYSFAHELYQEALWAEQQTQYDQYPPKEPYLYQNAIELWHEPAFAQSLRLYAGLLQGEQRKEFIRKVAQRNAYLAARCTTAYWQPEEDVVQMVVERAKLFAVFFDTAWKWSAKGFAALMELGQYHAVGEIMSEYEKSIKEYGHKNIINKKVDFSEFYLYYCNEASLFKLITCLINNNCIATSFQIIRNSTKIDLLAIKHLDVFKLLMEKMLQREMYAGIIYLEGEVEHSLLSDNVFYEKVLTPEILHDVRSQNSLRMEISILEVVKKHRMIAMLKNDWFIEFILLHQLFSSYKTKCWNLDILPKLILLHQSFDLEFKFSFLNYKQSYGSMSIKGQYYTQEEFDVLPSQIVSELIAIIYSRGYKEHIQFMYFLQLLKLEKENGNAKNLAIDLIKNRSISDGELLFYLFRKYSLQNIFSIEDYINYAIEEENYWLANMWLEEFKINNRQLLITVLHGMFYFFDEISLESRIFDRLILRLIDQYQLHDEIELKEILEALVNDNKVYIYKEGLTFQRELGGSVVSEIKKAIAEKNYKSALNLYIDYFPQEFSLLKAFALFYVNNAIPTYRPSVVVSGVDFIINLLMLQNVTDDEVISETVKVALKRKLDEKAKLLIDRYGLSNDLKVLLFKNALKKDLLIAKSYIDEYNLGEEAEKELFNESTNINLDISQESILNYDIDFNADVANKHELLSELSIQTLIETALEDDLPMAFELINKYSLEEDFALRALEKVAFNRTYINESTEYFVFELLNKISIFDEDLLITLFLTMFSKGGEYDLEFLFKKYKISTNKTIPSNILQIIQKGDADLVKKWGKTIAIEELLPPSFLIQTAIETNQTEVAEYWVQEYNLYHEFPQFEPPGETSEDENTPPEGV